MNIEKIDENFLVNNSITEPDIVWYDATKPPFSLHGVFFDEGEDKFLRMPCDIAKSVSEGVYELNSNTAGGRVRFKTNSSYIAISTVMSGCWPMPHMPVTGYAGFDIYRTEKGKELYFKTFVPNVGFKEGYSSGTKTHGDFTDYVINFPLYHDVKKLYIGFKKDAIVESPDPYKYEKPVVFYGSSITQGGCASRPGNSYQGFLSRRLGFDYINLGFSGSGKGESQMAEYIAGLDMSVFVMDYDANAPTPEHLEKTHYPFYKTIRDKNPDLPIILLSIPSAIYGKYYTFSETWGDFETRTGIIKDTYKKALADGDKNIRFIDGAELFAGDDEGECTVDGTHPNDLGFKKFADRLEKDLKPFFE